MLGRKQASSAAADSQFRKIDVDEYISGSYKDDEDQTGASTGPNEQELNALLSKVTIFLWCSYVFI